MARRPNPALRPKPVAPAAPPATVPPLPEFVASRPWNPTTRLGKLLVALAVSVILSCHALAAVKSLLQENPTVDEVVHLPAGVTYWQTGQFKLYHHNPPLVKLLAALPVVLAKPATEGLYDLPSWRDESQASFAHSFAYFNASRYFELFDLGRLPMPLFSVIGGLVVFGWSARLYGAGGGLLSLLLWTLCPNVLAHGRLCTSDMAATALGAGATYVFWRYLKNPTWTRASLAGLALGVALLSKFSLLLLYGLWPLLGVLRVVLPAERARLLSPIKARLGQAGVVVLLSVFVIDVGYGFESVFQTLGSFEFASRSLTRPRLPTDPRPKPTANDLLRPAFQYRINRFQGTPLAWLPVPLPRHYLLGFDEQKLESEGIPRYWFDPGRGVNEDDIEGYTVYLNGVMRRKGWWYYYIATLAVKVPEGTILLVGLSVVVLFVVRRSAEAWIDELTVLIYPTIVLAAMTFLTDINLGLRYILPIFPFIFISCGKLIPWATSLLAWRRPLAVALLGLSVSATAAATATIHPDYLAYFNWASGGPDHGDERLIDSNLDWGQDLLKLRDWVKANAPGERIGLAYFGQINPSILALRGDGFEWFLPPIAKGLDVYPMLKNLDLLIGPAPRLTPGYYAVSASLARGLPWRFYDSASLIAPTSAWSQAWNVSGPGAFSYFLQAKPIARVGHSLLVYKLDQADCDRLNALVAPPNIMKRR